MPDLTRLEIAVDAATVAREDAHRAFREAFRVFFDADTRLVEARLALADALPAPSDTDRKA